MPEPTQPSHDVSASAPGHILVVDDDPALRALLHEYLGENDLRVTAVASGAEMFRVFEAEAIDLVVLDLRLPGEDGMQLARQLRERASVPIVLLTGKAEEADRVMGLELGADDYVTKPYSSRELLARIKAVLRRGGEPEELVAASVAAGPVEIDVERHVVTVRGEAVALPLKEFELLEFLVRNAGRVLTRGQLIDRIWGSDYVGDTKTLDVHIKRLRKKIEDTPKEPVHILTVRGLGYKFEE